MDFGDTLRRAWDITWKNKGLWLLGILSGCSGGGGSPSQSTSWQTSSGELPALERTFENISPEIMTLAIVALVCVGLIITVVAIVLGTLGNAGLIAGASHADEHGQVSLGQAWRLGLPHFWRLLGVSLLAAAVILVAAVVIGVAATVGTLATFGFGLICLIPLLCVFVPLALLGGVYMKFVQNGVVVEKLDVIGAFRRAWELFRPNLGPVVVIGLILILIGTVAGLILAAPLLVLVVPALIVFGSGQPSDATLIAGLVCGAVYLPVLLVASGILQTYINSAWTLTYRRLAGLGPLAASVPPPA